MFTRCKTSKTLTRTVSVQWGLYWGLSWVRARRQLFQEWRLWTWCEGRCVCCDGAFESEVGWTCLAADWKEHREGRGWNLDWKLLVLFTKGFCWGGGRTFSNAVTVRKFTNLILLTSQSFHVHCLELRLRFFFCPPEGVALMLGSLIFFAWCLSDYVKWWFSFPVKPKKVACLWDLDPHTLQKLCDTCSSSFCTVPCATVSRLLIAHLYP